MCQPAKLLARITNHDRRSICLSVSKRRKYTATAAAAAVAAALRSHFSMSTLVAQHSSWPFRVCAATKQPKRGRTTKNSVCSKSGKLLTVCGKVEKWKKCSSSRIVLASVVRTLKKKFNFSQISNYHCFIKTKRCK